MKKRHGQLVYKPFRKKPDPPRKKLVGVIAIVIAGFLGISGTIAHFAKEEKARTQ